MSLVWKKLSSYYLSADVHDSLYLIVHNKLPVKERLNRIGLASDPYCDSCTLGTNRSVCDLEHYFCACVSVEHVWDAVRNILVDLIKVNVSNKDLIFLRFPKSPLDHEAIWLIGVYVNYVWSILHINQGSKVDRKKWFGFLKYKYRSEKFGARLPLTISCLQ